MMNGNKSRFPYLIQIKEPVEAFYVSPSRDAVNPGYSLDPTTTSINILENQTICLDSHNSGYNSHLQDVNNVREASLEITSQEQPCIVQVIYPEDLNLGTSICKTVKRGRPKKKKRENNRVEVSVDTTTSSLPERKDETKIPKKTRTRSGRLVKLPKHIEKDFKKIEISTTEDLELKTSDFKRFEEKENTSFEFTQIQARKRTISAQYRCPKCSKAYLGKAKMIQHLKKNPDHGPLPEGHKQEYNFDVWNYLFDITHKCKSGQRGLKFCEELSNLLHNVQLLKSALFKSCVYDDDDDAVQIDKVLGNAIGLSAGKYKFDENELYKDVTVLKLITNSEFFKPNKSTNKMENVTSKVDLTTTTQNVKVIDSTEVLNKTRTTCNEAEVISNPSEEVVNTKSKECAYAKKPDENSGGISVPTDLLSDNLLLHSLPNTRSSVDELILSAVDHGSNLLENSTSSDEVMNVDQFVNERFKKFIGPEDMELDLPVLEFQFNTS